MMTRSLYTYEYVTNIRNGRKHPELCMRESNSRDQIAALDAIGFDWRSYIEQWPEKHGHISLEKKMRSL